MPHKSGWREAKKQGKSTSADGAARVRITLHGAPCFTSDDPLPVSTPSKPPLAPVPGASTPAGVIFSPRTPPTSTSAQAALSEAAKRIRELERAERKAREDAKAAAVQADVASIGAASDLGNLPLATLSQ